MILQVGQNSTTKSIWSPEKIWGNWQKTRFETDMSRDKLWKTQIKSKADPKCTFFVPNPREKSNWVTENHPNCWWFRNPANHQPPRMSICFCYLWGFKHVLAMQVVQDFFHQQDVLMVFTKRDCWWFRNSAITTVWMLWKLSKSMTRILIHINWCRIS